MEVADAFHGAPRRCWVVSDGRRGIENQALGLAEAVARLTPIKIERRIAPRASGVLGELTGMFKQADPADLKPAGGLDGGAKPPDLWIACGRASLPYSIAARRWSGGETFVVQVQDPGKPAALFDHIVAPRHDKLNGDNVTSIVGAPNRITPDALSDALDANAATLPPSPRAAVLIGGDSKRHKLTPAFMRDLMKQLEALRASGTALMISTSRRTPDEAIAGLRARFLGRDDARLWTGDADGENPYLAFLAAADVVLVTKDSTNMLTDAASAGKPALLLPVEGADGKFSRLYAELKERGYLRDFKGEFESWDVDPLRETERAAEAVIAAWRAHADAANLSET